MVVSLMLSFDATKDMNCIRISNAIAHNDFRLGGSGGKLAIFNLESTTIQLFTTVFRKHLARHFAKPMLWAGFVLYAMIHPDNSRVNQIINLRPKNQS